MKTGNPIIDGINALLVRNPHCGLSYYGVEYHSGPLWWLDGITPVGAKTAIETLKRCGENVRNLERLYKAQEGAKVRRAKKRERLIDSAKKKLTRAEIAAVFL